MKMAGQGRLAGLFLLLGALQLGAGAQQTVRKEVGSDVTLEPKYTGNPSEINWKINGNKLVDMEVNSPNEPLFYSVWRDKATINRTNGVLTIKNLRLEDSGDYRAEALVNSVYQYTDITLTVHASPPVKPNITDPPPKKNDVQEETPIPGWVIALIVISVLVLVPLLIVLLIGVCYEFRDHGCMNPIYSFITNENESRVAFFRNVHSRIPCFKGNATDVEKDPRLTKSQQVKMVGSEVTLEPKYTGNPSEINWKINGNKLVDMKLNSQDEPPVFYHLQDRATIDRTNGRLTIRDLTIEDSGVYRAEALVTEGYQNMEITLTVRERYPCITVNFQTKDQPKGNVKPRLTIHDVKPEDHHRYDLEVLQSDGKKDVIGIKETDAIVSIKTEDDRVTLTVPDTEKVTMLTWKKGGITLFQWAVSSLKLHTNNITLKPGFVTVNNAEGEGLYKVEVHSTDNHITNNIMQLEVNNQGNESPTNHEEDLEEVETALLTEKGLPEPIGSITFHPSIMTDKTTLKKDGEPLNIDDDNRLTLSPYGDLTINNVTSDDGGKYTVQCDDQKLEFILGL